MLTEIKVYFHALLKKKKKSWKHTEVEPLRLMNSISCRLCPKGPALTLPRHFHCQERTWPWENVSWVAYLQLMSLLFSNVCCPLACYLCCHAESRGLDLLKIWEIRKRWSAEKAGEKQREARGANWLLDVTMARSEHESSSYRANGAAAGRKWDSLINSSVSFVGKDVNSSETSEVSVNVVFAVPGAETTRTCNDSAHGDGSA